MKTLLLVTTLAILISALQGRHSKKHHAHAKSKTFEMSGSSYFQESKMNRRWSAAATTCAKLGSFLLFTDREEELRTLSKKIYSRRHRRSCYWIGARFDEYDYPFQWTSGSSNLLLQDLAGRFITEAEVTQKDCLCINFNRRGDFRILMSKCSTKRHFICKTLSERERAAKKRAREENLYEPEHQDEEVDHVKKPEDDDVEEEETAKPKTTTATKKPKKNHDEIKDEETTVRPVEDTTNGKHENDEKKAEKPKRIPKKQKEHPIDEEGKEEDEKEVAIQPSQRTVINRKTTHKPDFTGSDETEEDDDDKAWLGPIPEATMEANTTSIEEYEAFRTSQQEFYALVTLYTVIFVIAIVLMVLCGFKCFRNTQNRKVHYIRHFDTDDIPRYMPNGA